MMKKLRMNVSPTQLINIYLRETKKYEHSDHRQSGICITQLSSVKQILKEFGNANINGLITFLLNIANPLRA